MVSNSKYLDEKAIMFSFKKFGKGDDSVSCFFFRKQDYPSQETQKTWGKEGNSFLLDGCYQWNNKEYPLFQKYTQYLIYKTLTDHNSTLPLMELCGTNC